MSVLAASPVGSVLPYGAAHISRLVAASIITSLLMGSPLLRKSFLREASVALAGPGNLLAASIPVEIAHGRSTTLYLLPARCAHVKSPPGEVELIVPLLLAAVELPARCGSPQANEGGYTPLHTNFPRRLNR